MKALQEALESQLKETADKAEKQEATVSVSFLCPLLWSWRIVHFFFFPKITIEQTHLEQIKTKIQ